jgi:hypothetical protein
VSLLAPQPVLVIHTPELNSLKSAASLILYPDKYQC